MSRRRNTRKNTTSAKPDLTAMIDVTFQLLIFFILCTRFRVDERSQLADLSLKDGMRDENDHLPKEQVTVYCQWDDETATNQYVVAIGARGRRLVANSRAGLRDLVILASDDAPTVARKRARYREVFEALTTAILETIATSGAKIEKLEISFAKNAVEGARSGTAPWMFVSLALDSAAQLNKSRETALPVTFKFTDALGRVARD